MKNTETLSCRVENGKIREKYRDDDSDDRDDDKPWKRSRLQKIKE